MSDPRPFHIGMEWPSDRPGGLNRYVEDLVAALAADGSVEPRALVLGPAADRPPWVNAVARSETPLPIRLAALARAARREVAVGADLLVGHFALYTAAALAGGREVRALPLVAQFHGPWADEANAEGQRSSMGQRARRQIERLVLRRADAVVCESSAFRRMAIESHRLQPWRVHVIPPGVDLARFGPGDRADARRQLGLDDDDGFVAVCVRRLVPRCGVTELAEAWLADPPGTLVIVGDGPERTAIETIAERDNTGKVLVLGRLTDDQLVRAYQAADVSVVPSVALEGFGLVSLEAMACGTPVVVADVGGAADPIRPLDPSAVVAAGDPHGVVERIRRFASGDEPLADRDELLAAAQGWDWASAATRHRALYRSVAGASARSVSPESPRAAGPVHRLVIVAHTAELGGAETMLARMATVIAERDGGADVHVIVGADGPLVRRLQDAGVSVEVLAMSGRSRTVRRGEIGRAHTMSATVAAVGYSARLANRIRSLRPDVVVPWTIKAGAVTVPAARAVGVPVVWMVHDDMAGFRGPARAAVMGLLAPSATGVIANAQGTADSLADRARRLRIVNPPGLDHIPARPALTDADNRDVRVTMVGRIDPLKGQVEAIEAFALAFPDTGATMRIVGAPLFGETAYADRIAALVAERGLSDRIECVGSVDDPTDELLAADIVVHASTTHEAWGMSVLEAMQCGAAVVATDCGGPSEQIDDGVTGRLVPPRDVPAMAAVLRELAEDPAQRHRLGDAAATTTAHRTPAASADAWLLAVADLAGLAAGDDRVSGGGHG